MSLRMVACWLDHCPFPRGCGISPWKAARVSILLVACTGDFQSISTPFFLVLRIPMNKVNIHRTNVCLICTPKFIIRMDDMITSLQYLIWELDTNKILDKIFCKLFFSLPWFSNILYTGMKVSVICFTIRHSTLIKLHLLRRVLKMRNKQ